MVGFLLTVVLLVQLALPEAAGFVVIVNSENPVDSLPRELVEKMFLKKVLRWEDWEGQPPVQPVDQRKGSGVRAAFMGQVYRQRPSRVNTYWQRVIFSGRGAPPLDLASDDEVMGFVRQNRGGIGYVAATTPLAAGVKAVEIFAGSSGRREPLGLGR